MIAQIEAAPIDPERRTLEVVERKGVGHPDTLCDAAAERFSRDLCRAYVDAEGHVLHHNVDKALLIGGSTEVRLGGGRWLEPIEMVLAGRATSDVAGRPIPVGEIGRAAVRHALGAVRGLDPARVETRVAVRAGAAELREVFDSAARGAPRANDTSIGVGFAPLTRAERLALAVDRRLRERMTERPASPLGEDTKIMVVRSDGRVQLTIAVAMIASHAPDERTYGAALEEVGALARAEARTLGFAEPRVHVNAADQPGALYLTLSGTSAECGDDGQVGRGNRPNGLITPMRPMTLEAWAGKNPCTHAGKLLSIAATRAAERCAVLPGVRAAECTLVSRIGAPVSEPAGCGVRLDASPDAVGDLGSDVQTIVEQVCAALPDVWREEMV